MKKTLVLGASPKENRYSYHAMEMLLKHDHEPVAVGRRAVNTPNWNIEDGKPPLSDIHTVTVYMNSRNQEGYYDYILGMKPQRVIFNPGAENPNFREMLENQGIEVEDACTLVLLSTGQF